MKINDLKKDSEDYEIILGYLLGEVALEEFAKPGCKYETDSGKEAWINIVSFFESKAREIVQDTYNAFVLSYLTLELKNDLVITNSFSDCSKACSTDQGQVRSANGLTPGVKTIRDSINTGLFHYHSFDGKTSLDKSCRHTARLYVRGLTPLPRLYKKEYMEAQRKITIRKRYVERQIRKYKAVENDRKVISWSKQPHDSKRVW